VSITAEKCQELTDKNGKFCRFGESPQDTVEYPHPPSLLLPWFGRISGSAKETVSDAHGRFHGASVFLPSRQGATATTTPAPHTP